jgi:hypothetical protein
VRDLRGRSALSHYAPQEVSVGLPSNDAQRVLSVLVERGLLLMQDGALPNVVALVVGSGVSGSWWSHPARHDIFRIANELAEHPDVCIATLLDDKRTFVHRAFWPALIAIGRAREPWQLHRLQKSARDLLASVDSAGTAVSSGASAKQLERALLVASEEVHLATGRHAKQLTSWSRFAKQRRVALAPRGADEAKRELELLAAALADGSDARVRLPWQNEPSEPHS